ncbi:hypothetical protein FHU30_002898 [Actinomadura rupiterrae]|nr:hypothetical protein [Actinomadura rupiterrae]
MITCKSTFIVYSKTALLAWTTIRFVSPTRANPNRDEQTGAADFLLDR